MVDACKPLSTINLAHPDDEDNEYDVAEVVSKVAARVGASDALCHVSPYMQFIALPNSCYLLHIPNMESRVLAVLECILHQRLFTHSRQLV